MSSFAVDTKIDASIEKVWETLADIGSIYHWNPGVVASHTTSDTLEGLGATRFCDLGGKNYLDEEVVAWKPNKQLTMRITGTNMPFKTADIHFYLRAEDGKTAVICSPDYTLKYGLIGTLMDKLIVYNTYQKGMESLLLGLKEYVEKG